MPAVIEAAKCNGCELCDLYCPLDVIHMEEGIAIMRYPDECWHCGACRLVCAKDAVTFKFSLDMMAI
jgi:ferredoxin